MAIFPSRPAGIQGNRFPTAANTSGASRKAAAAYNPNSAHTHSMLAQASRVPRLANIGSVQALLKAHAGASPGKAGRK
jgi:hypothetical protein